MKRRLFLALPAAIPLPAAAFRTEEAGGALAAEIAARCSGGDATHDGIRAMLERVAEGRALNGSEWRSLATCPFCRCQVAAAPLPDEAAPR